MAEDHDLLQQEAELRRLYRADQARLPADVDARIQAQLQQQEAPARPRRTRRWRSPAAWASAALAACLVLAVLPTLTPLPAYRMRPTTRLSPHFSLSVADAPRWIDEIPFLPRPRLRQPGAAYVLSPNDPHLDDLLRIPDIDRLGLAERPFALFLGPRATVQWGPDGCPDTLLLRAKPQDSMPWMFWVSTTLEEASGSRSSLALAQAAGAGTYGIDVTGLCPDTAAATLRLDFRGTGLSLQTLEVLLHRDDAGGWSEWAR